MKTLGSASVTGRGHEGAPDLRLLGALITRLTDRVKCLEQRQVNFTKSLNNELCQMRLHFQHLKADIVGLELDRREMHRCEDEVGILKASFRRLDRQVGELIAKLRC